MASFPLMSLGGSAQLAGGVSLKMKLPFKSYYSNQSFCGGKHSWSEKTDKAGSFMHDTDAL